jgi:hypothetical protein
MRRHVPLEPERLDIRPRVYQEHVSTATAPVQSHQQGLPREGAIERLHIPTNSTMDDHILVL